MWFNLISGITPRYRIEFDKKVKKFRNQYIRNAYDLFDPNVNIFINRNNIFYDAYDQIIRKNPNDLKKKIKIKYIGEEGIDSGGLSR